MESSLVWLERFLGIVGVGGGGCTHPNEAGREPALAVQDAAPPPLLVGGIYHFDDVTGFEAQLLVVHGDVVPQRLCVDHTAIADQLRDDRDAHKGFV